jgi:hypothetical protein
MFAEWTLKRVSPSFDHPPCFLLPAAHIESVHLAARELPPQARRVIPSPFCHQESIISITLKILEQV